MIEINIIIAIILIIIIFILNNTVRIPTGIPKKTAEIIESKMAWTYDTY